MPKFRVYHEFMIKQMVEENVPIYFMRYEDETNHSRQTLTELFRFVLNAPDIDGTVVKQRIDEVTSHSFEKQQVYKLKSTKTLNRNIDKYTPEQLDYIKSELKDYFFYFGYVANSEDPENNTPFFEYDDTLADQANYYGYKKHNAGVLSRLG